MLDTQFPWFPVLTGIGYTIGLYWSWWKIGDTPRRFPGFSIQARREGLVPASLFLLLGALIGGRISFAFLHWSAFQADSIQILYLDNGGLDWIGVPLGIVVACLIISGWKNNDPRFLLEDQLPLWTALVTAWWLSSGFYGLFYGQELANTTWLPVVLDAMGEYTHRIPLSWIGVAGTLAGGFTLDWFLERKQLRGERVLGIVLIQSTLLFALSFFRQDPVAPIGGFPSDRLAAIVYFTLGVIGLTVNWLYLVYKKRGRTQ
jgi:prolipoprotein diacylglyceryltransferase